MGWDGIPEVHIRIHTYIWGFSFDIVLVIALGLDIDVELGISGLSFRTDDTTYYLDEMLEIGRAHV